jgi:ABC-type multidrug transport system fused ATPase/permease subunit
MFLVGKYQASHASLPDRENRILQKHMNSEITSFQFSPYKEYSAFLMILFMALFLNSGIPVLLPLAWANLVSRYIVNRSLIQYSSTRVDGLGVSFNEISHSLLPVLLIAGCMNGCWMLTANPKIYPNALPFNVTIGSVNSWVVMQRELYLPFYIFMAIFILGEYLFYHLIIRFCACICSKCSDQKMVPLPSYTKTFTEHKKAMNILTSYNIRSNDKMRNVVTRMEMYINKELE